MCHFRDVRNGPHREDHRFGLSAGTAFRLRLGERGDAAPQSPGPSGLVDVPACVETLQDLGLIRVDREARKDTSRSEKQRNKANRRTGYNQRRIITTNIYTSVHTT